MFSSCPSRQNKALIGKWELTESESFFRFQRLEFLKDGILSGDGLVGSYRFVDGDEIILDLPLLPDQLYHYQVSQNKLTLTGTSTL